MSTLGTPAVALLLIVMSWIALLSHGLWLVPIGIAWGWLARELWLRRPIDRKVRAMLWVSTILTAIALALYLLALLPFLTLREAFL